MSAITQILLSHKLSEAVSHDITLGYNAYNNYTHVLGARSNTR